MLPLITSILSWQLHGENGDWYIKMIKIEHSQVIFTVVSHLKYFILTSAGSK